MKMVVIATTRFNKKTWIENEKWRETNQYNGCIYGTPFQMAPTILLDSNVFMLEMHNDENKVKGIGLVVNRINVKKYYNIYSNKNYNRYTYKSEYRIDRDEMTEKELVIMKIFDKLLFKTPRHLKRGSGITKVPNHIIENKYINFVNVFKNMFSRRFENIKKVYGTENREKIIMCD